MKMEITEKKVNPLFNRTEIRYTASHISEPTPTKAAVVDEIAKLMKVKKETVVLYNVDTVYGCGVSKGYAKVYESKEAAQKFEPEHLLKRNGIQKPEYVAPAKSAEE
ncbi:MAG: 30S ribosomal protein S24e [Candidatus Methanomethylophilaceae archaeon]|jgi:small subunit ribosomal protein S24e